MSNIISRALAAVALALALIAGVGEMLPAHAATTTTVPAPTAQMVKACEAYRVFYYSRTAAHLDAMISATFTGAWSSTGAKYIIRDDTQYYTDVRTGAAAKYIAEDQLYLGEDCNKYVLPWL